MSKRQKDLFPDLPDGKKYVSDIPELMAEWHPTKNKGKQPEDYTHGSSSLIWWHCNKGHEWKSKISNRSVNKHNCPFCNHQRPTKEYNLKANHPDIAAQWDYDLNRKSPEEYLPASGAKVHWRCERGHEYAATISNRTKQRSGCPQCSRQSSSNEIRILSEIETLFSDVKSRFKFDGYEVDIFISSIGVAIEYDGSYWHKNKDEKDKAKTAYLKSKGFKVLRVRENPLKRIESWDITLSNAAPIAKSELDKIVLTICNKSVAEKYISQREFVNDAKYRTYLDYFPSPFPEKSLATLRPDIAVEWDYEANSPLTPSNFTVSAAYNASWICSKGHKWQSRIATRTGKKSHGCGYCSGRHATLENNLTLKHPELLKLWDYEKNSGFQPEDVTPNSGQKVWWKCPVADDHSWEAVPYSMTMKTHGKFCPFCNGRKVSITNCLATTHPSFISIWHPTKNGKLTPWNVTAGSDRKVWFICANDASHEYQGIIYNMTRPFRRKFCPHCGVKGMITRPQ